jgi:hypothetical protein
VTDKALRDRMTQLAAEGKQPGWWQSYELDFATYVGLEQAATWLCYYQSSIVPGLLQTPEYARAMHRGSLPAEFTPERADKLIEVRLRRQQVLTRDPPLRLEAILDEAVLHRVVGSLEVMAAQLQHLVKAGNMPNVTLRAIPNGAGAHPAMDNMFNILEFGDVAPRLVYVEGLMGWLFIERERDVIRYEQVLEHLREIALDPKETIDLISKIGAQYNSALRVTSGNSVNPE